MSHNETDGLMFTIDDSKSGTVAAAAHRPARSSGPRQNRAEPVRQAFDLAWLLGAIRRSWFWILLLMVLGAVVAGFISTTIPPKYQSTAQMIIDPRELRVLQNEVTPGAVGSDSTTAYAESQARVLASDSVKMRLIESEHLDKDPEFGGKKPAGRVAELLRNIGLGAEEKPDGDPMLKALRALERTIVVRRGERTFVIDIQATAQDPQKAARLANGLANAYLDEQNMVRSDTAKRTTAALSGRLDELRQKLREAENKAEKFKAQKDIVGAAGKLVNEEQLSMVVGQLQQLRSKTAEAKAKHDQVRTLRPSSLEAAALPEAVASNTITALRAQLGAALNREADLLASLGARHPSLAAARTQVQDARRQINDELGRISQASKIELDRALAAEKSLAAKLESLKQNQVEASRSFVDLRELEREIESSRVIYESFLRRARETAEQVGVDTTNARLITTAIPPENRTGVSRKAIIALGGILGVGLGLVLALLREMMARRNTAPVRAHSLGAAAVADVQPDAAPSKSPAAAPPAAPSAKRTAPVFRSMAQDGETRATSQPASDDTGPATAARATLLASVPKVGGLRWKRGRSELASVFQGKGFIVDSYEDTGSPFAAAIRQLRTSLQPEACPTRNRKILVTALRPGAGSSTIALNMALAAANEGRTPLLVDAGQGDKTLTQQLAADATLGFQDVMTGSAGMVRAALQDEETGVFFLPRLGKEATGSTAIAHLGKAQLLERFFPAVRRFDSVIVDGSALGTDQMTQAFADAVDDIVLVVETRAATAGDLAAIDRILGNNAGKIRGFVVNRA